MNAMPLKTRLGLTALFVLAIGTSALYAAHGPLNQGIPYQGRLELAGQAYSGPQVLRFRLWDSAAGGVQMHDEEITIVVSRGAFSTVIGEGGLADTIFTTADLYIEVGLGTSPDTIWLAGRQRIFAAAQAVRAERAVDFTLEGSTLSGPSDFSIENGTSTLRFGNWGGAISNNEAPDIGIQLAAGGEFTIANRNGERILMVGDAIGTLDGARLDGDLVLYGDADINGDANISGDADIGGDIDLAGSLQIGMRTISCASISLINDCSCPAGYAAIGGGSYGQEISPNIIVRESRPVNVSTWRTSCMTLLYNFPTVGAIGGVSAVCSGDTFVQCARLAAD